MLMLFPLLAGLACPAAAAAEARLSRAYCKLQLHFEANRGQTHDDVRFLARGPGYSLFLTPTDAVLTLIKPESLARKPAHGRSAPREQATGTVLHMKFAGANRASRVAGLEELPGKANYFIGSDPAKWRTNVPTYAKVQYRDVYPGIDLVYYGNQRQLEYDFVVRRGADPTRIVLGFQGADKVEVDVQGDLVLHTAAGPIRQQKPVIYQEVGGVRKEIPGGYVLKGKHQVGFKVARYDARQPLVIDPVLFYSTFLGGSGEDSSPAIAVDAAGNAYVTGRTFSPDFPTTAGAFQASFGDGSFHAFVTKLNSSGSALVYSTYLGGSGADAGSGIAVDTSGQAFVTGNTNSSNFPTTTTAFQTTYGGGGCCDAFVTQLNAAGSGLVYSTYLGGSGDDEGNAIAVDPAGNAYVSGLTDSTNLPTTAGAFQTTHAGGFDAFVTKLDPAGASLVYSTYLGGGGSDGGSSNGIAADASGNAYVTGTTDSTDFPTTMGAFQTTYGGGISDAFVTKLDPAGAALVYSTYLGRSGEDWGSAIAVEAAGNAYLTGGTFSPDFPTTMGAFQTIYGGGISDGFVTKLNSSGSALVYSTYLGGSGGDAGFGIAVDTAGKAFVAGNTNSSNFPTTMTAFQRTYGGGGCCDAFVTQLDAAGSALVYSTYLGGSGNDGGSAIAVDALPGSNAYVTGFTNSADFPTTEGTFQALNARISDAFLAKIADVVQGPHSAEQCPPSIQSDGQDEIPH
jgi:beta-propeller repeat-containing protein